MIIHHQMVKLFFYASSVSLDKFTTFGALLKYLCRRAGLTQRELSIAVGYSESQISRLEQNQRLPDLAAIAARFVQELDVVDEPATVTRLLKLAAAMRSGEATRPDLSPNSQLSRLYPTYRATCQP